MSHGVLYTSPSWMCNRWWMLHSSSLPEEHGERHFGPGLLVWLVCTCLGNICHHRYEHGFMILKFKGGFSGGQVCWVHVMTRLYSNGCRVNQLVAQKSQSSSWICCNNWACPRVIRQTDTQQFHTVYKAGAISHFSNSDARMAGCQTASRWIQQKGRVQMKPLISTGRLGCLPGSNLSWKVGDKQGR